MTLADFWESTPREVFEFVDGAIDRFKRTQRLASFQAYYAGAIARSGGRLPSFGEMFPETSEKEAVEATPEAHLSFWETTAVAINAREDALRASSGQDPIIV